MIISETNRRRLTLDRAEDGRIVISESVDRSEDIVWLTFDELAAIAKACPGEKSLAEKQQQLTTPVKVEYSFPGLEGECGKCQCGVVVNRFHGHLSSVPKKPKDVFCPNCGAKLEWV